MADERIYITEVKEGAVCPFEEKCEGFYKLCEGCNVLPTRQEVIERMANTLKEKSEQMARECLNSDPYNNPWGAEDLAEAALNALLEDK